jgi:hypothetical protein
MHTNEETADYADELASVLEEPTEGDGCHLGPSDAAFAAKAIRLVAELLRKGPTEVELTAL